MTDPTAAASLPKPPKLPDRLAEETVVFCPGCRMPLSVTEATLQQDLLCRICKSSASFRIFPRLTKEIPPEPTSQLASGNDATCQFYPELKVDLVCDECGCFMSRKASISWGGKTMCMPCLHTLREQKNDTGYRADLKIWDNRALALLSLLPLTLFTTPIALFFLIRFRKETKSWIPRGNFRWWLAMVLAILLSITWIALIIVWIAMVSREMS